VSPAPSVVVVEEEGVVVEVGAHLGVVEIIDRTPRPVEVVSVGAQGPRGLTGPQGPQGPQGEAAEGSYAVFHQLVPAMSWTITHNLGFFPSVTVVDSAGSVVIGDVAHVSDDEVVVGFSLPFAGSAYLS
jgi:hypothetical protein